MGDVCSAAAAEGGAPARRGVQDAGAAARLLRAVLGTLAVFKSRSSGGVGKRTPSSQNRQVISHRTVTYLAQ